MDELVAQLITYARGVWRWRWIAVGVAWLVGLGAAAAILLMPPKYEASARVHVDTQSVLRPLLSGLALQPDLEQQVALVSRTLISRPNVERLIRMTDMDLSIRSPADKEDLIETIQRSLEALRGARQPLLDQLSRQQPRPGEARRAVAAVDLRGIEPRQHAQGHRCRAPLHRGADPSVREAAGGSRSPDEGFPAEKHAPVGGRRPRLFRAHGDARRIAEQREARASSRRGVARCPQARAGGRRAGVPARRIGGHARRAGLRVRRTDRVAEESARRAASPLHRSASRT